MWATGETDLCSLCDGLQVTEHMAEFRLQSNFRLGRFSNCSGPRATGKLFLLITVLSFLLIINFLSAFQLLLLYILILFIVLLSLLHHILFLLRIFPSSPLHFLLLTLLLFFLSLPYVPTPYPPLPAASLSALSPS